MKKIMSAAVTPFTEDGKLDLESARKLYEFGLSHALDGFFVFGTAGEWALLTHDERDLLAEFACGVIGGRARLLLGISDTGLPSILGNMERWSRLSHSHWALVLPAGWAGPSDPVKYVHQIADAADRPLYLYYMPSFNRIVLTPEQFRDIVVHPNVAGLKNSAGEIRIRKELLLLKRTVDFELFEGEEWGLDEALIAGCDGGLLGFGSVAAKLFKALAHKVDEGEYNAAADLQFKLVEIYHAVYGDRARHWLVGQKYALKYMGILASEKCRSASQQDLLESHQAAIRACIDTNRELLM